MKTTSRSLSPETIKAKNAVVQILRETGGQFTVDELATKMKQPKPLVSRVIKLVEIQGNAKRVGTAKCSGRGRPAVVWSA